MQVTFTFDSYSLYRPRYLTLFESQRCPLPQSAPYQPIHNCIRTYQQYGYPFSLLELLHATGLQMVARPYRRLGWFKRTFLATGGLYLALDLRHPDLALREAFGDFTAGFSHQFGVGLSTLFFSQALDISWDMVTAIPPRRTPTLDFSAPLPNGGIALLEAKGVTSLSSGYNAYRSIVGKKTPLRQAGQAVPSGGSTGPDVLLGCIVQAVRKDGTQVGDGIKRRRKEPEQATMEILDPPPSYPEDLRFAHTQRAARYWHYAGVAIFAGIYDLAREYIARAEALLNGNARKPQLQDLPFEQRETLFLDARNLIGIQWRPSDLAQSDDDVWFYQAADREILRRILVEEVFPQTVSYHFREQDSGKQDLQIVTNVLPDGSFFGIGRFPLKGLRVIDLADLSHKDLEYR